MKVSERTIAALRDAVTGNSNTTPYRSGSQLVEFFNELGFSDVYGAGFSSRGTFASDRIRALNGTARLAVAFETALDPRDFLSADYSRETVVDHLNEYLKYDGYELVKSGDWYRVRDLGGAVVDFTLPSQDQVKASHVFIDEQIRKCSEKILEGDSTGAITNARTLLEAVLLEVEAGLAGGPQPYDGDLPRLHRRTMGLLNLDSTRPDIEEALKQVLRGLTSAVQGLATMRNEMSDAHAARYATTPAQAKLAVNAAMAVAGFVVAVYEERLS